MVLDPSQLMCNHSSHNSHCTMSSQHSGIEQWQNKLVSQIFLSLNRDDVERSFSKDSQTNDCDTLADMARTEYFAGILKTKTVLKIKWYGQRSTLRYNAQERSLSKCSISFPVSFLPCSNEQHRGTCWWGGVYKIVSVVWGDSIVLRRIWKHKLIRYE